MANNASKYKQFANELNAMYIELGQLSLSSNASSARQMIAKASNMLSNEAAFPASERVVRAFADEGHCERRIESFATMNAKDLKAGDRVKTGRGDGEVVSVSPPDHSRKEYEVRVKVGGTVFPMFSWPNGDLPTVLQKYVERAVDVYGKVIQVGDRVRVPPDAGGGNGIVVSISGDRVSIKTPEGIIELRSDKVSKFADVIPGRVIQAFADANERDAVVAEHERRGYRVTRGEHAGRYTLHAEKDPEKCAEVQFKDLKPGQSVRWWNGTKIVKNVVKSGNSIRVQFEDGSSSDTFVGDGPFVEVV